MNIAAITVTYNDGFKLKEWVENYNEYNDAITRHIIVDNGSSSEYLNQVKLAFPNSIIIERHNNGGSTGAYNDGIRKALEYPEIDSILLVGNDIKISSSSINALHDFLNSDERFGMVAPLLLKKDSDIVEAFGCKLAGKITSEYLYSGKHMSSIKEDTLKVDWVPGGINLSKISFYKKVGLQDEDLFMYGDEIDMCYRSKKAGFSQGVTKASKAWHRHINPPFHHLRPTYSYYLIARNSIYLSKKHFGDFAAITWSMRKGIRFCASYIKHFNNREIRQCNFASLKGIVHGLKGYMNNEFNQSC